jgi:hypothetical protein
MNLIPYTIDCQSHTSYQFVNRQFNIIQCTLRKNTEEYNEIFRKAEELAQLVNAGAANKSEYERGLQRRRIDSFGGLCAEYGWEKFINSVLGNIASPTTFTTASVQIDIQLPKGEKIEVRSSFPYKGVKFALCNSTANFKNIGPYSNSVKPGEVQKHLYLAVLFDTQKEQLLTADEIKFSLVGGSTWDMMVRAGENVSLIPRDDDSFAVKSTYRVVYLKNALDAQQVIEAIAALGYNKKQQ